MFYVVYDLVQIWLGAVYGYALIMFAKHRNDEAPMPLFWKVHLWPLAAVVLALDVAFNATFGWMFLEKPKDKLFSGTVQWHYRNSGDWRGKLASFWKGVLNWPDPGHIRK